jgi:putative ABC transport system permease protein
LTQVLRVGDESWLSSLTMALFSECSGAGGEMVQDIRFVLRSFDRQRGFFSVSVLTIALGIAFTATIFSVADNLLYRPLPYPQPSRLYQLFGAARAEGDLRIAPAAGDYLGWRGQGVFDEIAAYRFGGVVPLGGGVEPHRVNSAVVDDRFLSVLGVQPYMGRAITAADCRVGAPGTVLITASLWRHDFGADPSIVDRMIEVDGVTTRVVGVLPDDFLFPAVTASIQGTSPIELLRPMISSDVAGSTGQVWAHPHDHNLRAFSVIGRLSPSIDVRIAQARLDAIQQAARPLYRPDNTTPGPFDGVTIEPLQASITPRAARDGATLLLLAALGVLLVAVVNIVNMFLARGTDRERELAIRTALGAGRVRLMRLLLVEAGIVAMIGGLLGLLGAFASFEIVLAQLPVRLMALRAPHIDVRVVVFAWIVSSLAGLACGLLPALKLSHTDLASAGKQVAPTSVLATRWFRDILISVEVAAAMLLVGVGTLVLHSFANVMRVDVGMDVGHVLTMQIALPAEVTRASADARASFLRNVLARVQSTGIEAALTDSLLMMNASRGSSLVLEGTAPNRVYRPGNLVSEIHISPDYFRVMGIPIVQGQPFPAGSQGDEPIAVVSDRLQRMSGIDPVGRQLVSLMKGDTRRYRVIGMVQESRERAVESSPMSSIYLPFDSQLPTTLVVRAMNPVAMIDPVRRAIREAEPYAIVDHIRTLDDLARQSVADRRFNAFLYAAFSVSALALAMIGVYGVIVYSVRRRAREIGIRIALGATKTNVISLVTARTGIAVMCGVVAGIGALFVLHSALGSLMFGIPANDPATLTVAVLLIGGAAGIAAYVPSRRASLLDPMDALRAE